MYVIKNEYKVIKISRVNWIIGTLHEKIEDLNQEIRKLSALSSQTKGVVAYRRLYCNQKGCLRDHRKLVCKNCRITNAYVFRMDGTRKNDS